MHLGIWPKRTRVQLEVAAANVKATNYANISSDVPCNKDGTKVRNLNIIYGFLSPQPVSLITVFIYSCCHFY